MNINEFKAEIARANLTIPKLAELINVSKKTLYSRVNGEIPFTQKEIAKIANVLRLTQEKIFIIFLQTKWRKGNCLTAAKKEQGVRE